MEIRAIFTKIKFLFYINDQHSPSCGVILVVGAAGILLVVFRGVLDENHGVVLGFDD